KIVENHKGTETQRLVVCLCVFVSLWFTSAAQARPTVQVREFVNTYCVSCHSDRLKTANLALDKADAEQVFNSAETWEKVIVKLRSRSMPPAGNRRPDNATYDTIATLL